MIRKIPIDRENVIITNKELKLNFQNKFHRQSYGSQIILYSNYLDRNPVKTLPKEMQVFFTPTLKTTGISEYVYVYRHVYNCFSGFRANDDGWSKLGALVKMPSPPHHGVMVYVAVMGLVIDLSGLAMHLVGWLFVCERLGMVVDGFVLCILLWVGCNVLMKIFAYKHFKYKRSVSQTNKVMSSRM